MLPKIHKHIHPESRTYPGRPVVGASGNLLYSIDKYITELTAPILPRIPASLKDTGDLLRDLNALPPDLHNCMLFSADVVGLYPNIPWNEGIEAATWFYNTNYGFLKLLHVRKGLLPPPDPDTFRRLLELVLTNSVCQFQEECFFLQVSGTAMGSSISVYLANAFMARRLQYLVSSPPDGLLYFSRYIDDIIGVSRGLTEEKIIDLFTPVATGPIKLTWVFSTSTIAALDVLISLTNGRISTSLFRKKTDGHQYVHWHSDHPLHLKISLPFTQFLRIKRICSSAVVFEREALIVASRFRDRGYPETVIQKGLMKARDTPRELLLQENPKAINEDGIDCFVTLYDGVSATSIPGAIKSFYKDLRVSQHVTERLRIVRTHPFPNPVTFTGFKVADNLGSALGATFKKKNKYT